MRLCQHNPPRSRSFDHENSNVTIKAHYGWLGYPPLSDSPSLSSDRVSQPRDVVSSLSCIIAISKLFYFQGAVAGDKGVEPLQTRSQSPARYHYANPLYNQDALKKRLFIRQLRKPFRQKANGLLQDLNLYLLDRRIAVCVLKRLFYILITLATMSHPDKS